MRFHDSRELGVRKTEVSISDTYQHFPRDMTLGWPSSQWHDASYVLRVWIGGSNNAAGSIVYHRSVSCDCNIRSVWVLWVTA